MAGLRLLLEVGLEHSWRQTSAIHQMLRQELSNLSATLVTPEDSKAHAGLIAFKSVDEHKLVSALDDDQVIVSSRDGNVRISPHFYNTEGDVEALMKSLFGQKGLLVSSSVS